MPSEAASDIKKFLWQLILWGAIIIFGTGGTWASVVYSSLEKNKEDINQVKTENAVLRENILQIRTDISEIKQYILKQNFGNFK